MDAVEKAVMLRVYLGESDEVGRKAAYKAIVELLRKEGIAGATVLRGVMGFGKKSVLHTASPLRLSGDLPVVIEVVDAQHHIERVLPKIAPMVRGGLIVKLPVDAFVRAE